MALAMGFLLRILYGASICGTWVSGWLYLTVLMFAIYMGTGKRRKEHSCENSALVRHVLQFYTMEYFDKIMQMSMTLAITFYSLWSVNISERTHASFLMVWTVPMVFAIIMRYEMLIEKNNYGDPTELILSDKILLISISAYGIFVITILYGKLLF